jgi:transcriptional regulator with XRE-family HTH domain
MSSTLRVTSKARKDAGAWLATCRLNLSLTQREIAKAVGFSYYSTVSEIESGKGRVPPSRYVAYARALKQEPKDFVKNLLRYYDRDAWNVLFGNNNHK